MKSHLNTIELLEIIKNSNVSENWLEKQLQYCKRLKPLDILPAKRMHNRCIWNGNLLGCYAGYYQKNYFNNLLEFIFYSYYFSSTLQDIYSEDKIEEVFLGDFVPPVSLKETFSEFIIKNLSTGKLILDPVDIRGKLEKVLGHIPEFSWLLEFELQYAFAFITKDTASIYCESNQGFFKFFTVDDA